MEIFTGSRGNYPLLNGTGLHVQCTCSYTLQPCDLQYIYIYIYILFSRVLLIVTQCGIKHAHFTVLYDVFTLNHTVGMIWSYFQN